MHSCLLVALKILGHSHFIVDTEVHEVGIANSVYSGNHDVLNFGVFVPQVDPLDGIVPMNPASFPFNLSERFRFDLLSQTKTQLLLSDYQD